ncbi:MAG TPA: cysteine desulfurase family protein [Pirellulales bacterium]
MPPIYLDFNSTAPLLSEVAEAMTAAQAANFANPASQHSAGRAAHRQLEDAREAIAGLLGANLIDRAPDRLIFTSGGTEANNLALFGLADASIHISAGEATLGRIIISVIEHPSVTAAADHLARMGWQVDRLRANSDGLICLTHLDELLAANRDRPVPSLVSVMLANNETGAIQPIAEVVRRCQPLGIPVHTDAVQAAGKIPIDFRALGVSAMSVAPHKFGGPRGIGALILKHGITITPTLYGATQQGGIRPGTESVALPIGFLTALRMWTRERKRLSAHLMSLRDQLEAGIRSIMPLAVVNGADAPRLPHTSNIAFLGHDRQALFMALDLAGICCSTGSACASGSSEPSPTLVAMNLSRTIIESSLRFSFGPSTTAEEINAALARIAQIVAAIPWPI